MKTILKKFIINALHNMVYKDEIRVLSINRVKLLHKLNSL